MFHDYASAKMATNTYSELSGPCRCVGQSTTGRYKPHASSARRRGHLPRCCILVRSTASVKLGISARGLPSAPAETAPACHLFARKHALVKHTEKSPCAHLRHTASAHICGGSLLPFA